MQSTSVVILAYNEEECLRQVVAQAQKALEDLTQRYEIILVNDGSTDKTSSIMKDLASRNPNIKVLEHAVKSGMGASIKDGFDIATCDLLSFFPADGEIPPTDLYLFAPEIANVDFVTSYYTKTTRGLFRKIMSKSVRLLLFILFGYQPRLEGSYLFKRRILNDFALNSKSFTLNVELVIKAYKKGYKFKEVGTVMMPRLSGKSKVANIKTIIKVFIEIIKLRINFR